MASSGQLKTTIADALRLPAQRVDYPYRVAREANEISRGKRGKGGASVTPEDAAKALTAIAASVVGDELLSTLRAFCSMRCAHSAHFDQGDGWRESQISGWDLHRYAIPRLQKLARQHTFIEAFTAIVESARDRAFENAIRNIHHGDYAFGLSVTFSGPDLAAAIEFDVKAFPDRAFKLEVAYLAERSASDADRPPFEKSAWMDHRAIYAVANLFRYEGVDAEGVPLDPEHPWNREGAAGEISKRREQIEAFIDARGFD